MRDACEQCGNVVGGRSLIFVHMFSWSCVHLSRHCVGCVGYGLNAIVTVQQHGLCIVPFVVLSSVCSHCTWKDSWRERRCQRRGFGRPVAALSLLPLGQFQKMRSQLLPMLFVPRVNVVRKCLLICSRQEQANKTTHDHHCMCLWPKSRIPVSQICVVVP